MDTNKPDWRKGNHNATGHQKPRNGNLIYGDGCRYAKTCFRCPLPDCTYDTSNMGKLKREVAK
jgi:hypothetical protein